MPKAKKAKAAVLERSRRTTAGKRMASLVGKAQEDDDTFWSHSIWSEVGGGFADKKSRKRRRDDDESSSSSEEEGGDGEDEGSVSDGEGSYRMSDEDSAAAVDQFDSDFDESESDADEGDDDREGEEERELREEERREAVSKRKKNQRLGMPSLKASAGRELMRGKAGKMTKRGPVGEGMNHGLVLNWPPPTAGVASAGSKPGIAPIHQAPIMASKPASFPGLPTQGTAASALIPAVATAQPQHIPLKPATHSFPPVRQIAGKPPPSSPKPNLRTSTIAAPPAIKPTSIKHKLKRPKATTEIKKKIPKQKFTQEELILEAIKSTETENSKWLSGRNRNKEDAVKSEKAAAAKRASRNQNPISRFHSRRGCPNTLAFMDMDHLPDILTRKHAPPPQRSSSASVAVGVSPRRRAISDSITSSQTTAESSTTSLAAGKNQAKCVITGKIARYRDSKTLLGYHDVDAYKELRRRLEKGELKISKPSIRNTSERMRSSSSAKGANGLRGGGRNSVTNFPFAADQPTMVAQLSSASRRPNVKVMVTQDGFPVSPPPGAKLPLKLSGKEKPIVGPPLPPLADQNINGKTTKFTRNGKSSLDGGLQVGKIEPLPILPISAQHIINVKSAVVGEKEPPPPPPISAQQINEKLAVDISSDQDVVVEPVPMQVPSSRIELQTSYLSQSTKLAKPIELPQSPSAVAAEAAGIGNGKTDEDDGVQIQSSLGSSASGGTTEMPESNGKAKTTNNNGTGESASDNNGEPANDTSKSSGTDTTAKDKSSKNSSKKDHSGKGIVPKMATSNGKRTTIEAN